MKVCVDSGFTVLSEKNKKGEYEREYELVGEADKKIQTYLNGQLGKQKNNIKISFIGKKESV